MAAESSVRKFADVSSVDITSVHLNTMYTYSTEYLQIVADREESAKTNGRQDSTAHGQQMAEYFGLILLYSNNSVL